MPNVKPTNAVSDLRGASRAVIDAVEGITDVVENLHRNIAGLSPVVGLVPPGRARGITGFVYRSVRGVTQTVGVGIDAILAQLPPLLSATGSTPRRDAAVAALNGVFGDYLDESNNPLATRMQVRVGGRAVTLSKSALAESFPDASEKLTVLVHGLCMNDLQWKRDGHDHGETLARELGHSCVYLHYNTGRRILLNGREFAVTLETLIDAWPVPVKELAIIGHSMGGLVARSACQYAAEARHRWPRKLTKLICIGTPHHGARLERAGSWIDMLLGVSPYSAPFARLGLARSAGIKDLRHGDIGYERRAPKSDATRSTPKRRDAASPAGSGARCYVIAGTTSAEPATPSKRIVGDRLVSVASALGQHDDPTLSLRIPASRQFIAYSTNHLDLLSSREVCDQLCSWLAQPATRKPRLPDELSGVLKA